MIEPIAAERMSNATRVMQSVVENDKKFYIGGWSTDIVCDTTDIVCATARCASGHMQIDPWHIKQGLMTDPIPGAPRFGEYHSFLALSEYYQIRLTQIHDIFSPAEYPGEHPTSARVLGRMEQIFDAYINDVNA